MNKYYLLMVVSLASLVGCEKDTAFSEDHYKCVYDIPDSSQKHPNAATYQEILDRNRSKSVVGAVLLVKDKKGVWMGGSGQADIASNIDVKPCQPFLIASISKVFTSAAVYRYADDGLLSIEDPISQWLDPEVVEKVANADLAQVQHLLSHTSGIPDFYTTSFELDRVNRAYNGWAKEDVLEYVYNRKADFEVGATYGYCNTNFLLLAMILEQVSGKSFESVYYDEVFTPLALNSAYYSATNPIPSGAVKGYVELYGNGQFVESEMLYKDELGIGGDGGIAINAFDLAMFLEKLWKGQLISTESLNAMTNWFDLPQDWHWDTYGQVKNGYGVERFDTKYGWALGHTGGIDGFSTYAFYFPESDKTYVLLQNTVGTEDAGKPIFEEVLEVMFKQFLNSPFTHLLTLKSGSAGFRGISEPLT